ncbi:MAG TPA: PCYCGC motif-containing (lipo)protein [Gemmatimonadota bacterium]|nr:PCYCGC motif-containing (lipo)protein [Gemmatimonadota bacterium]
MRAAIPIFVILVAGSLLAACGREGAGRESEAASAPQEQEKWVTIDSVQFPAAMAEAPAEIVEAYVFAAKHPEVLRYMPCYCGCHREAEPHANNYDCFVDAIDTGGAIPRVDPDPMGFG